MFKKITKEPSQKGVWAKVRSWLLIDPARSSGLTFNESYRNPMPGSRPEIYKEPVTAPANDIAENPYHARDVRRQYPRTVHFDQSTVAGLLTYGNKAAPAIADGDAGNTALAKIGELSLTQAVATKDLAAVLGVGGLPPTPRGLIKRKEWVLDPKAGFAGYKLDGEDYPVRVFT